MCLQCLTLVAESNQGQSMPGACRTAKPLIDKTVCNVIWLRCVYPVASFAHQLVMILTCPGIMPAIKAHFLWPWRAAESNLNLICNILDGLAHQ